MQWRMLQQDEPEDFVIATGETNSVQDMINLAFKRVGIILTWSGEGVDTIAVDQNGVTRVKTNPKFFRPAEVDLLIGDSSKIIDRLKWSPNYNLNTLIDDKVDFEINYSRIKKFNNY